MYLLAVGGLGGACPGALAQPPEPRTIKTKPIVNEGPVGASSARIKKAGTQAIAATDEAHAGAQFVAATELAISSYTPRPYPRKITIFKADDPFDSPAALLTAMTGKA